MWRDTSRKAMISFIEAHAILPIMIFLFHMRIWTFCVAIGCIALLVIVSRRQIDVMVALRFLRAKLAGAVRPVVPWTKRNKL